MIFFFFKNEQIVQTKGTLIILNELFIIRGHFMYHLKIKLAIYSFNEQFELVNSKIRVKLILEIRCNTYNAIYHHIEVSFSKRAAHYIKSVNPHSYFLWREKNPFVPFFRQQARKRGDKILKRVNW